MPVVIAPSIARALCVACTSVVLGLRLIPWPAPADAAEPPTPSPPATTVSAEDELSPDYQSENGSSNQVNLRAQLPYDDARWLVRIKLPIVTAAPSQSVTGAGDLALWDLAVFNSGRGQWLAGPTLRIPTAKDSLGTNKYSLGPAAGYVVSDRGWTLGFFGQSFFSIIGPSSYPPVGKTQIDPVVKLGLQRGWSVGFSTMQFTYDWVRNRWTDVPLGLRVGKSAIGELKSLDAYMEGERNLARAPDTPGWTVRALVRWTFSGLQNAASDAADDR